MNLTVLIVGGVIVIVLLIIGVVVSINSERRWLSAGTIRDEIKPGAAGGEEASRSIVTEWMNRRVASSSMRWRP
jgi:hypothetical protein